MDGEDHVGRYRLVHEHKFIVTIITIHIIIGCTVMRFIKYFFFHFSHGHLSLAKYLIEDLKCSPTCTDADGRTPLHEACR